MSRKNAILLCVLVGCVALAASGCRCHRTGRGFVIRSQWTLECDNVPRLSFDNPPDADTTVAQADDERKPELLRWRIRRRGYQLASRLLGHSDDAADQRHGLFASASQKSEEQSPAVLPEPPEVPAEEALAKSTEADETDRSSKNSHSLKVAKRPDLVLE